MCLGLLEEPQRRFFTKKLMCKLVLWWMRDFFAILDGIHSRFYREFAQASWDNTQETSSLIEFNFIATNVTSMYM